MKNALLLFILAVSFNLCHSQYTVITLNEAIEISLQNALELQEIDLQLTDNELAEILRREQLKPTLAFSAALPSLSRSIEARALPDGRDAFVNRSTMYNRMGLNFEYTVPSTNSVIFGSSSIERLDILRTNSLPYSRNYFFTPLRVGIEHSFFRFNENQWNKEKIQLQNKTLILDKAYRREIIITEVIQLYLEGYQLQQEIGITDKTIFDTDSIYEINKKLYDIGVIGKIELLRLDQEKSRLNDLITDLQGRFRQQMIALNKYLQFESPSEIYNMKLEEPFRQLPDALVMESVVNIFLQNDYVRHLNFETLRNYETELERTIQSRDIRISFSASAGANNADSELSRLIAGMQDQESLGLSLYVPLTSAKTRKTEQEIALNNLQRAKLEQRKERLISENNVQRLVDSYNQYQIQIQQIQERKKNAQQIYDLAVTEYLNGTLSLSDLFISNNNLTSYELSYNNLLSALLNTYFEIRAICMYDFVEDKSLIMSI